MGDLRFIPYLDHVGGAKDPLAAVRALPDEGVVAALAAASSRTPDPYLANVLATEIMNRMRRRSTILDALGEAVVAWDRRGQLAHANPAARRLLGLVGVPRAASRPSESDEDAELRGEGMILATLDSFVARVLAEGAGVAEELVVPADGGPRRLEASFAPILNEGEVDGVVLVAQDVTDRRQAEEALQESEERFRALADATVEGIVIHRDGRPLVVNRAFENLLGVRTQDILGKESFQFVAPESREDVEDAIATNREEPYEAVVRRKDGSTFIAEITARTITYRGEAARVGAIRDVSAHKQAEGELFRRAEQLRALAENSPDIVARFDRNLRHVYVNRAVEVATGLSPEDFLGKRNEELGMELEMVEYWQRKMTSVFETGKPETLTYSYATPDGERHYQSHLVPERAPDGSVETILGVTRDVTDLKNAEAAARAMEDRFHLVTRATNDVIWDYDLVAGTLWWNENLEGTFGWRREDVGDSLDGWTARIHPEDRDRVEKGLHAFLETREETWKDEYRFIRADGEYAVVFDRGLAVRDDKGRALRLVGSMMDVSQRKRIEEGYRRMNEVLEHRVRERTLALKAANAELEAFTYSVSHDLRGPLRGIEYLAHAIVEDAGPRLLDEERDMLRRLESEGARLSALVTDLLELSRVTSAPLTRRDVDVSALAAGVAGALAERDPERRVRFEVDDGLVAFADETLLRVVLENLFSNAWKFTRDRVDARVGLRRERSTRGDAFVVEDNGVGFDPEHAEIVFTPFTRLHRDEEFEGTGIGLATVRRIVQRHGGEAWAESSPGEGARIHFTLPR